MNIRHLLSLTAVLLIGTTTARAHRVWILPAVTVHSGTEQWVSVEAAVSNNLFFPNHRAVNPAQIEVRGPDGTLVEIQNATTGQIRGSFEVHLQQQGTYVISMKQSARRQGAGGPGGAMGGQGPGAGGQGNLMGTYEQNGKTERWRGTPESLVAEGMAKKPGFKLRETGGRTVVTFVTLGKPSTDILKPTGKGLEIDYVTHPNDLFTGEPATFRILLDGQPAAGATLEIVRGDDRYRDEEGALTLHADKDGVVKITWPQAGRYWVETVATQAGTLHGVPSEKSFTHIATYEVLPH
jgi:uncharacterized GH25 family protein